MSTVETTSVPGFAADAEPGWVRATARLVQGTDAICRWSGHIVAFATLATVLLCFATVYLR